MKYLFFLLILCTQFATCQILMDSDAAIKIGNTTQTPYQTGSIRWNPSTGDFEGFNGTEWVSFTAGSSGQNDGTNFGNPIIIENQILITPEWDDNGVIADGGFGSDIDRQDSVLVVGAPYTDVGAYEDHGAVYIVKLVNGTWQLSDTLYASDGYEYDQFGISVAISGEYIFVGAKEAGVYGRVYVFQYVNDQWTETQKLFPPSAFDSQFGYSVDIDGEVGVVSAYLSQVGGNFDQGKAYMYQLTGSFWSVQDDIVAPDGETDDQFGYRVALDSNQVAISAPNAQNDTGSVYIFEPIGNNWIQLHQINGQRSSGGFGAGLDFKNNQVIVSNFYNDIEIHDVSNSSPQLEYEGTGQIPVSIDGQTAITPNRLLINFTNQWYTQSTLYTSSRILNNYTVNPISCLIDDDWIVICSEVSFPFNFYEALFFFKRNE